MSDINSNNKTFTDNNKAQKTNVKVACILDNFSYQCLKYECNLVQLHAQTWRDTILKEKPDFLLVESAWRGLDESWNKKVGYLLKTQDNTLERLVSFCRSRNIPTVFWNKEDPYHHEFFLPATRLFDYIFTTDAGLVQRYRDLFGHDRVYDLPFAAQPMIHNPVNKDKYRLGQVCFAGTWYNNRHEDRKKNLEMILGPALKYDFHIYDRNYNITTTTSYRYPDKYQPFIKGCLQYDDMVQAYKKYNVFLNVNSVDDSATMFSRRVFELLASGSNIISSYSIGIENMFPDIVKLSQNEQDTAKYLDLLLRDKEMRDRLSLKGLREVFGKHTYKHRFEKILDKIGMLYKKEDAPGVSIIIFAYSNSSIQRAIENFQRQNYNNKELIILARYNTGLEGWKEKLENRTNIKIFFTQNKKFTGELLSKCMHMVTFDCISQFKDDYYAEYYLSDLMAAFKYSNADIIGKQSYYAYIDKTNTLVCSNQKSENEYVDNLCTSAMIIRKSILDIINVENTENGLDEAFLEQCVKKGIKMYSTDRFNYVKIIQTVVNDLDRFAWEESYFDKVQEIDNKVNYIDFITV